MSVWWDTSRLESSKRRWQAYALDRAGAFLEDEIRFLISVQGVPQDRRSLPGEPPRRETGDLANSWTHHVDTAGVFVDVYSPIDYSYYLEVGANATFGYIAPRPYIRRSLLASANDLHRELTPPFP